MYQPALHFLSFCEEYYSFPWFRGKTYIEDIRKTLSKRADITAGKDGLIIIEVLDEDPQQAADMANAFPAELDNLLQELGRGGSEKPEYIISGIPFGNLGGTKARALLDLIRLTLGDTGMYIQFQHSLLDRKNIRARFPNTRTVLVLLNFPPAVVYYAQSKGAVSAGEA